MKESNVSNLTKALAVVSLLAPVSAQPLGIGEIELHSVLNQKLNAEIRLNVAPGENPADVTVKLAPPEKFDQAGVVWNYFLSKIKLEPVVQANGSIIVKVSSREALTEPFLDFLLEVSWPQGSMMREFTLLIDPPTAYNQPVIPSVETSPYTAEPIERPAKKTQKVPKRAVRAAPADAVTPQTPTSGEYGPIQKSDTLWSIANQVGQEKNVPAQQMLTALYKANPDAFNKGNINSLKEGATLKIPEADAILSASQRQVSADQKANRRATNSESTPVDTVKKQLELVAPVEPKAAGTSGLAEQAKAEQQESSSKPKLVGSAGSEQASDAKDIELQARIEKLEQQLGMMQQLLALKDQQLANLQNNKQPQPVSPVTPTPNADAGQAAPQPPTPAPESTTHPAVPTQVPEAVAPVVAPQPEPKPVPPPTPKVTPPPPAPVIVEDEGLFSADPYYWFAGSLGAGMLGLLGWLMWRKRQIDERTNTESMFASASQIRMPDAESSLSVPIMDINSTDEYDVGTVGESSFISDFTPSDFDAFDTDQNEVDPISEADVYLAYGRYQQAEELIRHAISEQPNRDECKLKLLEIYYASENKDSFAGYVQELADAGKQADKPFWKKVTEMAKEIAPDLALFGASLAAATAPTNDNDTGVVGGTDNLTDTDVIDLDESFGALDDDLAELEIDRDLAFEDNGLDFDLGGFGVTAKEQNQFEESATPKIETIDFPQSITQEPANNELETIDASTGDNNEEIESLDFELELETAPKVLDGHSTLDASAPTVQEFSGDLASSAAVAGELDESVAATESFEAFDFNFDTDMLDDVDEVKAVKSDPTETTGLPADLETFDFNFDDVLGEKTKGDDGIADEAALSLDSQLKLETFDFADFDSITPISSQNSDKTAAEVSESSSEFDFDFDFDAPLISATGDNEFELGVSDLTDMDEFETKIDLAKAYIDMGDTDAAKMIVEDVLVKGSKQQQQTAQALLDELK